MKQDISFNIYVLSYQRANAILTKDLLEYCTYVVRYSDEQAYREAGVDNLLVIPKGATTKDGTIVWSFMTTLYWTIENTPEDVIFVADDDIKSFVYRLDTQTNIKRDCKNYKEVATAEIERIAQLLYDLELGFACDNPQPALYNYTQEFMFKGMPGGIRWINKQAFKASFNAEDYATSDVDMMLQELLMNRIILQPRYFHSLSEKDTNSGGTTVDSATNYKFRLALKNKWGKYFDYDFRKNQARINVKR